MKAREIIIFSMLLLSICTPVSAHNRETGDQFQTAKWNLDGKSFHGRIRAKGLAGLFSAEGTLSFKGGHLIWSVAETQESAPYQTTSVAKGIVFSARLAGESNTYIDWSGLYDGVSLTDVKAIWTRTEEEDFIHDLFLPDVVELRFTPENH